MFLISKLQNYAFLRFSLLCFENLKSLWYRLWLQLSGSVSFLAGSWSAWCFGERFSLVPETYGSRWVRDGWLWQALSALIKTLMITWMVCLLLRFLNPFLLLVARSNYPLIFHSLNKHSLLVNNSSAFKVLAIAGKYTEWFKALKPKAQPEQSGNVEGMYEKALLSLVV